MKSAGGSAAWRHHTDHWGDHRIPLPGRCHATTIRTGVEEGLLCGISTGLNVVAAPRLARELGGDSTVVTLGYDSGSKYLTTDLFPGVSSRRD